MSELPLISAIQSIAAGNTLAPQLLESAFEVIFDGNASAEAVGAFLMGLAVRGETASELVAGARVMRAHAQKFHAGPGLLDTCGTGGLNWKSLNTSTAAALVIAACGGKIAKHGNRSVPPKTGSADVLEALGVNLDCDERTLKACLDGAGVAFMFARNHHSAMRHVAPIRKTLGIRTVFNLLGPLTNPANADFQILGVFAPEWVRPMAETLAQLGVKRAWVVHGIDGIDEISIAGVTKACEILEGNVRDFEIVPEDAGLKRSPLSTLEGGNVDENSHAIRELLEGREGPFRDVVCLNAAAGLVVTGRVADLKAGVALAGVALDSGRAANTLEKLVHLSHGREA